MKCLVVDFETYYDREYSLSKMTTEAYINDPRFEVIGVSVMDPNDDLGARWVTGDHDLIAGWLAQFDWDDIYAISHNAAFDSAILAWKFGIYPKAYGDTLSMARAIHGTARSHSLASMAKLYGLPDKGTEVHNMLGRTRTSIRAEEMHRYAEYCKLDTVICAMLFEAMVRDGFPRNELKLIDLTIRMYTRPQFELHVGRLETHLQEVREAKAELMRQIEHDRDTLMSNPKFAEALREMGVEPPMKISARTGKETFAFAKTDPGFKALLEHEDDRVQALVAARMGIKTTIEETRTETLIDVASRTTKLPIPLRYHTAITGRWGGCLVADSRVLVYDYNIGVLEKRIVDVLPDDLVWDGVEFVAHEGVQFSGFLEVIEWDGITGTPDHKVFTESGGMSLHEARQRAYKITVPRGPEEHDVARVRAPTRQGAGQG